MSLSKKLFNNTGKPQGILGKMMVSGMNSGHAKMASWGMSNLPSMSPTSVADLGCGGGKNIEEMLKLYPLAKITGVDYSDVSVDMSKKRNERAIEKGRCSILKGDVSNLPLEDDSFDFATAFETIYFWPGPLKSFKEVFRILRSGGSFFIVNESDGNNEKDQKWVDMIDKMHIYTEDEITGYLKEAGFSDVQVFHKRENFWIAFLAKKA